MQKCVFTNANNLLIAGFAARFSIQKKKCNFFYVVSSFDCTMACQTNPISARLYFVYIRYDWIIIVEKVIATASHQNQVGAKPSPSRSTISGAPKADEGTD
jgi:hypothetical protein